MGSDDQDKKKKNGRMRIQVCRIPEEEEQQQELMDDLEVDENGDDLVDHSHDLYNLRNVDTDQNDDINDYVSPSVQPGSVEFFRAYSSSNHHSFSTRNSIESLSSRRSSQSNSRRQSAQSANTRRSSYVESEKSTPTMPVAHLVDENGILLITDAEVR